jgi:hypothetical protein
MRRKHLWMYLAALVLALPLGLAGCGDSDTKSTPSPGIGNPGGTVAMNSLSMVVPQGAVDNGMQVVLSLSTEDAPPAAIPAGASIASKTVVISGITYNFMAPALVTIPYFTTDLGTDDVPGVFFYDQGSHSYCLVGVKSIDTDAKTITFSTTHGGKYLALGIRGLGSDLGITGNPALPAPTPPPAPAKSVSLSVGTTVDTGFSPATDGFFHPNFGAFEAPGGSSLGMANFSAWYYLVAKAGNGGTGLHDMYQDGDESRWQDDLTARELISRAFMASSQDWAAVWNQSEYKLSPQLTGYLMVLGLKLAGPVVFLMADQMPGLSAGHATVVYKFDAGQFFVYDNNFPGEVVTIDWAKDASNNFVFSNYSKNAAYNPQFTQFAFEGFASFAESDQYQQLFTGAQAGWAANESKFNTITITSATDSLGVPLSIAADGTIELIQSDTVTIQGKVTGGATPATYLFYRLNGGKRTRVALTGDSFTLQLPQITLGSNTLMMVASDDMFNEYNPYGGFKEVPIRIKGLLFFENAGFESLPPFDKWIVETHTWDDTTPGSFTPGKSAIVTPGMDPIATSINMVYVGNQSARVNNSDNNLHISSVTQSATVPNAANPQAKFYWAAVLQDPGHDPSEQPYVDVVATDDTAGTTLYSKHFYSNDPSYPGWLTFGQWKAIPWQTITMGFTRADAGHRITIKVSAADCSLSGHGGYVYLDGDE